MLGSDVGDAVAQSL